MRPGDRAPVPCPLAILALANWPRFNANDPLAAPESSWENQAVGFSYELGSTFKPITVGGALQDGLIAPDTRFNIPPSLQVAVLMRIYMVDALLTPIGVMVAFAAEGAPYRAILALPLIALFAVLFLAYSAGANSGGLSIGNFGSLPRSSGYGLWGAFVICLAVAALTIFKIGNRVLAPVKHLSDFSERLAHGDFRAKADVDSGDDFGYIAENLNRAAQDSSRAMFNQEAQDSLQKSVTEFLTITSQIARGDQSSQPCSHHSNVYPAGGKPNMLHLSPFLCWP